MGLEEVWGGARIRTTGHCPESSWYSRIHIGPRRAVVLETASRDPRLDSAEYCFAHVSKDTGAGIGRMDEEQMNDISYNKQRQREAISRVRARWSALCGSGVWRTFRMYAVSVALFLFGLHLHAQVERWGPLWKFEHHYSQWGEYWTTDGVLASEVRNEAGQTATARWLMVMGFALGAGLHFTNKFRKNERTD